jgi:putative zincin peptidase
LPQEGRPAYVFELSPSVAGVWTLLSLVLFVAAAVTMGIVSGAGGRVVLDGTSLLLWPLAFLATLALHELVHAALVLVFGGRPAFGAGIKAGMPYLYVTNPGRRFTRNQFLAIALAPLLFIDLLALALVGVHPGWTWAAVAFVVNTSGAVGDIWVVGLLLRFPASALVEDRTLGFAVWPRPGQQPEDLRRAAPRGRVPAPRWLAVWLLATLASLVVLPIPAVVVMQAFRPHTGGWLTLGAVIVLSGLIGSLAALVWSRRKTGPS